MQLFNETAEMVQEAGITQVLVSVSHDTAAGAAVAFATALR